MLLTVAELRKHLPDEPAGDDNDDALRRLLEAAEAAITETAGPLGAVTEFSGGGGYYVTLSRQAASITSVTETYYDSALTLDPTDYRVSPSGFVLTRLYTGPNPRYHWFGQVKVVYTPVSDVAARETVQVLLVKQFLNYEPSVLSRTIGSWTEQFALSNTAWADERDAILATLRPANTMVVI